MDYSGRKAVYLRHKEQFMFQSFCINGLLWKWTSGLRKIWASTVSILLYQWITLEEGVKSNGFCSGKVSILLYQWITLEGHFHTERSCPKPVSILLYQWITLEDNLLNWQFAMFMGFNPSVSMDYSGRPFLHLFKMRRRKSFNPSVSMDYSGRKHLYKSRD